jgi:uncharacterized membrane protein YiaA
MWRRPSGVGSYAAIAVVILAAAAAIEFRLGRVPWCTCGYVKLWHGVVQSSENSQHLSDWYSFTHVTHGIVFYFALWLVARRLTPGSRFVLAVLIEAAWEVVENSPFIIDRYRAATISGDYYGDSVVNSMADVVAMMIGFWIAKRLPVWAALGFIVATEAVLAIMIRDNLALNILMLVYPLDGVKRWQLGG